MLDDHNVLLLFVVASSKACCYVLHLLLKIKCANLVYELQCADQRGNLYLPPHQAIREPLRQMLLQRMVGQVRLDQAALPIVCILSARLR